jgi:hypothetical protein
MLHLGCGENAQTANVQFADGFRRYSPHFRELAVVADFLSGEMNREDAVRRRIQRRFQQGKGIGELIRASRHFRFQQIVLGAEPDLLRVHVTDF